MARKYVWEIDEKTSVQATLGAFGKLTTAINGAAAGTKRSRKERVLTMPGGRTAIVKMTPRFASQPLVELWLDGKSVIASPKGGLFCPSCKHTVRGYDSFCGACGKPLPTADDYRHKDQVKDATTAIKILGVIYLLFGIATFFVNRNQTATFLAKLDSMDPASNFPQAINGITYTVAQVHERIVWESWSLLITNLVLAACMGVLAFWSRRAPLAAVLVAAASYVAVNVLNAILDPATIGQGIYMKIIIIVFLVRGIRSALAMRPANG